MFGDNIWAFVVVGGFVILAAAIGYAKLKNKQAGADEPVGDRASPPHYNDTIDPRDGR